MECVSLLMCFVAVVAPASAASIRVVRAMVSTAAPTVSTAAPTGSASALAPQPMPAAAAAGRLAA